MFHAPPWCILKCNRVQIRDHFYTHCMCFIHSGSGYWQPLKIGYLQMNYVCIQVGICLCSMHVWHIKIIIFKAASKFWSLYKLCYTGWENASLLSVKTLKYKPNTLDINYEQLSSCSQQLHWRYPHWQCWVRKWRFLHFLKFHVSFTDIVQTGHTAAAPVKTIFCLWYFSLFLVKTGCLNTVQAFLPQTNVFQPQQNVLLLLGDVKSFVHIWLVNTCWRNIISQQAGDKRAAYLNISNLESCICISKAQQITLYNVSVSWCKEMKCKSCKNSGFTVSTQLSWLPLSCSFIINLIKFVFMTQQQQQTGSRGNLSKLSMYLIKANFAAVVIYM